MKKLLLLLTLPMLLAGCYRFGAGETIGYVYAVDDGVFWDTVWFKTSLESSESDCYNLDNDTIKTALREETNGVKLKLTYTKHLLTFGCESGDEVTSFVEVTE